MHSRVLNALSHRQLSFVQEENAALTYTVNWAALLDTDQVSTSTWTAEDSGLTIANENLTTDYTTARLSGDVGRYRAVNKIVTTNGDTHERYINVTIKDNTNGYAQGNDYGWIR